MESRLPAEVFASGNFLREEIEARGWTQVEFARVSGIAESTIAQILQGTTTLTPKLAQALGTALGTSPDFWETLENARR